MVKRLLTAIVLVSSIAYGQEPKPVPKPKLEPTLEAIRPPEPKGADGHVPILGKITAEQREEILRTLREGMAAQAPNIFNPPKVQNVVPIPPEAVYKLILADLQTIRPEDQQLTRYLSLYSIKPEERKNHIITTMFVLNSVSWSHRIMWPEIVPNTNGGLLRFNVANYSRNEKDIKRWLDTWEFMTSGDVYFLQPWVSREDALAAAELTGSAGCVLRADWFNFYITLDDNPDTKDAVEGFYSKILGLPDTEEELLKQLFVNLADIASVGTDRSGIVTISGEGSDAPKVASSNRKVNRTPTTLAPINGYFYYTQDVINSTGKRNFLQDPLSTYKDGGEYIWRLPNGLQAYYIAVRKVENGKEVFRRASEVPINIARDPHFDDGIVKIRSCVYCHQNGINSFRDAYSILTKPGPPGGLVKPVGKTLADVLRLKQLYYQDTPAMVSAEQLGYKHAVLLTTGLSTADFREVYKKCLNHYYDPVTPEQAVWEFGVAGGRQGLELFLADKVVSTTQGSLLGLVKGLSMQRDTFEEEFKNGKLLQEIKKNIIPKNNQTQINMVVPSAVVGTAQNSRLTITETPAITLRQATKLYQAGSSRVLTTIPADITLKIQKTTESNGIKYAYVEYRGRKGWIQIDE